MYKRRRISEEKAKIIFEGAERGTYIQFFKDDAAYSPVNGPAAEAMTADGKAVLHNRISEYIFMRLAEIGIPTYFIRSLNMREQLVHSVEMIPLRLVCRNNISPDFARRFGLEAGAALPRPLFEFYGSDTKLDNPLVSEEHILTFGWANEQDLEDMLMLTARINDFLCGLFAAIGLRLADFKLEFGRLWSGDLMQLVLAAEISPDSCRLWENALLRQKYALPLDKNNKQQASRTEEEPSAAAETASEADNSADYQCVGHKYVAQRLGLLNENRNYAGKGPVLVHS